MTRSFHSWGERYLYRPDRFQRILSSILFPLSWLYCALMQWRFEKTTPKDPGLAVISVGNLTVGGSGKTPLVSVLAARYDAVAIVLRGYGRQSRGMHVVTDGKHLLCDVHCSGDEAMIYATKLSDVVVIVSEDREEGIEQARKMGMQVVFLDDGYGKHQITKLDLVIDVKTSNDACLPSGPYRERLWPGKEALVLSEERDFFRHVNVKDATGRMVLVTAIARPERLDAYLPTVVARRYFPDHHFFSKEELERILEEEEASSLLVTFKDYVKIADFDLPLSLLDLELEIDQTLYDQIDTYVESYR